MVGIYAPNQATQRIALWGSLLKTLYVGRPGLLMGDFNMCVDESQSMLEACQSNHAFFMTKVEAF